MSILKTPYEISVWEDRLTLVDADGNEYDKIVPEDVKIIGSYFKEIKLCIIGSNSMNTPIRAQEPELRRNIKGENTLTFSIYAKYYDEDTETFIDNPFIPYLVNERKIKLKYYKKNQIQWLDFIIKNIEESSDNYKYTYTAKDLFINELAGNGFDLVFDQKLENNMGTVNELGAAVLKGTDWEIGENSENIQQFQEEALYKIVLSEDIEATNIITNENKIISKDKIIYGFYSSIVNKDNSFFQFIYNENNIYLTDDNRVIYNADSYFINLSKPENDDAIWPTFAKSVDFIDDYRGERIVRYQETTFDKVLNQYVQVYTDFNKEKVYGYSETKFISEQIAQSFITNGSNFVSNSGWRQYNIASVPIETVPSLKKFPNIDIERQSTIKYINTGANYLFNSGFSDNKDILGNIVKNDLFAFRIKCGVLSEDEKTLNIPENVQFIFQVKSYKLNKDGNIAQEDDSTKIILEGKTGFSNDVDSNGYFFGIAKANFSISEQELIDNKYGIFIKPVGSTDLEFYYIQDVQFFRCFFDKNNNICLPDGTALNQTTMKIEESFLAYAQTVYYYYYPNKANSKEEIEYIHIGEKAEKFEAKYTNNFEKIRSITASETNRFDLLQTLAETFECWCRFDVKHKDTGEIMLWKDFQEELVINAGDSIQVMLNSPIYNAGSSQSLEDKILVGSTTHWAYQQVKFITFHKQIGQENNVDFVYGINLKSINRKLESDGIISKLNVKNNDNEFAPYGSCSISRAAENLSGENFIYDFNYYINQGLLNYENLNNDLYSLNSDKGWIGYYTKLKNINNTSKKLIDERAVLLVTCDNYKIQYQSILLQYEANIKTLKDKEEEYYDLTSYTYELIPPDSEWLTNDSAAALRENISRLRMESASLEKESSEFQEKVKNIEEQIEQIDQKIKILNSQKQKVIRDFEKKYYRFIQEAPWISNDYTDDNLYYLDANSILQNSSQPKVSYTINIIELSQIENFENYTFELGDITHIQDTEFFGWVFKDNKKTPYREKIVVTEEKINFDNSEKNTIKVQNYRSQFEDLFQRITTTTQKIEFHSGAYNRAANIINPDGSIASEALQDAFANNAAILKNANNNSVTWDEKGIITKNILNLNEIVRITSGGIFLTNDGGQTWTTGITGQGINAKTITTGQLNTELITILNGNQASFRWDSLGINAYKKLEDGHYSNKNYVRFDQYGIYGINNLEEDFEPKSEEEVWQKANFALTWNGFMLKKSDNNGSITIDSKNDINLLDSNGNELIHIGYLGENAYGMKILGEDGEVGLLAKQDFLSVGGWNVKKNELYASKSSEGEVFSIKLLSADSEEPYQVYYGKNSISRNTWRILIANQFGIDYDGRLYSDHVHTGRLYLSIGNNEQGTEHEYLLLNESGISHYIGSATKHHISWDIFFNKFNDET